MMFPRAVQACAGLAAAAVLWGGCGPDSGAAFKQKIGKALPGGTPVARPPEAWTPERIAADPAGYLQYAGERVGSQIEGRRRKLAQLTAQRGEVEARAQALATKVSDAQNIAKRLRTAMQRADDENNWPVKMAGRTFDAPKAEAVIKSLEQFVADRQQLVQAYGDAMNRIGSTEATLQSDVGNLERMREKIGLDQERVRLNQGLAELGELHKTETELATFSKTLADMSEDVTLDKLGSLGKARETVDADSLLR